MKGLIKNKKGKTTIEVLISLIVIIVVFGVILFFIWRAGFKENINSEICKQSIIERATLKAGPLEGSKLVPLKCKTKKICFTMSGNDCDELISTSDNPVKKVELSKDSQKAKTEIKKEIAEAMVDCHSMLGEGQLNFMPHKLEKKIYGLVCTRIAFDDEAKSRIDSIGYGEMYAYLENQMTSDNRNYLEYLYPDWKQSENSIKLFKNFQNVDESLRNVKFKDWKMSLNQERGYAIISMLAPYGTWQSWAKGIGVAAIPVGGVLLASGVGAPVGAALFGVAGIAGVISGGVVLWQNYGNDFDYAPPFIYPFNPKVLKEMGIYSFEIAP